MLLDFNGLEILDFKLTTSGDPTNKIANKILPKLLSFQLVSHIS